MSQVSKNPGIAAPRVPALGKWEEEFFYLRKMKIGLRDSATRCEAMSPRQTPVTMQYTQFIAMIATIPTLAHTGGFSGKLGKRRSRSAHAAAAKPPPMNAIQPTVCSGNATRAPTTSKLARARADRVTPQVGHGTPVRLLKGHAHSPAARWPPRGESTSSPKAAVPQNNASWRLARRWTPSAPDSKPGAAVFP